MTASKTSATRSSFVSSKSKLVMSPFILFSDTNRLQNSDGSRIKKKIGVRWCVTLFHTLPAPIDDASVIHMYCRSPGTILYTLVGCWEMSISSVSQSSSVSARSEARLMFMILGIFSGAVLSG